MEEQIIRGVLKRESHKVKRSQKEWGGGGGEVVGVGSHFYEVIGVDSSAILS